MTSYLLRETRILWLLVSMIIIAGASAFMVVPRLEDPTLTKRAAIVNTSLGGADANRVEALITENLLDALRTFEEVKELRSTSRANISTIAIVLKDEVTEVDEVWARMRDELEASRSDLPLAASPPDLEIVEARAFSYIAALKWASDSPPQYSHLRRWTSEAEDVLRSTPDTGNVERFGDPTEEVRVEVEQARLSQLGMTLSELAQSLSRSDAKVASGAIHSNNSDLLLEVAGEFDSLERIKRVVVRSASDGQTAYLGDIARVFKTIADPPKSRAIVDGQPAIIVAALVNDNVRLDRWTSELETSTAKFQSRLPPSIQMTTLFRQADYVRGRMRQLVWGLTASALTVVAVVFFMMGWRSALIVGSALPLASCMVFAALRFLGIPFHQMSLSGLVIALGMLEGTAIIIVDEVQRNIRKGQSKTESLHNAITHMAMPLFGATATTIIAFMPIATMPGPSGEFVGTIGTSVILAVGAAFLLSLTVIPTLSALTTPSDLSDSSDRRTLKRFELSDFLDRGFTNNFISKNFERFIRFAFARPLLTSVLGIALALPGFLILPIFAIQFFPGADRNQFHIEIDLAASTSIEQTESVARDIQKRLSAMPEVKRIDWVLGESAPSFYYNMINRIKNTPRYGQALVTVHESVNTLEFIRSTQQMLDESVLDALVRVRQLQQGPPFNAPLEIQIFGNDVDVLRSLGDKTRQLLLEHPDTTHSLADMTDHLQKYRLRIREEEARLAGIELSEIARQLDVASEGRFGGSLLEDSEELPVRVRLSNSSRRDTTSISAIQLLPTAGGPTNSQPIPLSTLGDMELTSEPATFSRLDDRAMNEVRVYLQAGVLPSKVLNWFRGKLANGALELPPGYEIKYGGESSKRSEATSQLLSRVSLLAIATIIVLVVSLKSFRASGVILIVGVIACGVAFMFLFLTGYPLGFTAIVGAMGMVGVAINDSMVVLSELRRDNQAARGDIDSIVKLVLEASRHVLSTTLTVGCSFIPLILGGGTFWPPMAMVFVGGVFGATFIALVWIPAVHRLIALTPLFRSRSFATA